ncbi:hypothetical protein AB1283_00935 [Bacillus sp. S13(2024)]|uniref:hypothetical protein n=1 Tax=Bacillus sp. S13(2024) TaxID=3162885 RepID=UPI003D1A0A63
MGLQKGNKICAIDENRILTVEGFWGKTSQVIDFSARYDERHGVDTHGNDIFGNRGFRFKDEGGGLEEIIGMRRSE